MPRSDRYLIVKKIGPTGDKYSCGVLARHTPPSEGYLAYFIQQASQPSTPSEPAGAHDGEDAADQVGS
ncbi:hypothetical protein K466DRAFT_592815 [Polyporus arcularius HHB13444]|uniref:Uncharacterized protein n=1 Tax=Polyporus arcularius HHB13444 TaxID=1314778 RepID=A0A5C3NLN7_9APHY|nr:hypothetical protein K466DRAFT_592815 [Polyporus arcularius HHB13444]